jgi:hypothetical protein
MDQEYMTKMASSFLNELSEIEKRAFLGTLARGAAGWGKALGSKAGTPLAKRFGIGKQGLGKQMSAAWKKGAGKDGSWAGGLKGVMQTQPAQMAATAAVPIAGGYGLARATE